MPVISFLTLFLLVVSPAAAEDDAPTDAGRTFVSSSLFVFFNLLPEPPHYYQLNVGHRVTERDTVLAEAITWTYPAPLGIPYGPDWSDKSHHFPGFVRDVGVGVAYQRFWWKGAFTAAHAMPFYQTYHRQDGERIQAGFQLFLTARVGYHFAFFDGRMFIEPSVSATWWPINTNLPEGFAAKEDRFPSAFVGDPGLNLGVHF